ncbi:hypothetical protein SDJN03_05084, partial [Cucurbita argyrosperma subsp. sororia]
MDIEQMSENPQRGSYHPPPPLRHFLRFPNLDEASFFDPLELDLSILTSPSSPPPGGCCHGRDSAKFVIDIACLWMVLRSSFEADSTLMIDEEEGNWTRKDLRRILANRQFCSSFGKRGRFGTLMNWRGRFRLSAILKLPTLSAQVVTMLQAKKNQNREKIYVIFFGVFTDLSEAFEGKTFQRLRIAAGQGSTAAVTQLGHKLAATRSKMDELVPASRSQIPMAKQKKP